MCWERLSEGDVALVFMKDAERYDPRQAVCVLLMLQKLGRKEEAVEYAERIIADNGSAAEELYQAAATLARQALGKRPEEAKPIFERLVSVLGRALRVFRKVPKERREILDADRYIITLLGFSYAQVGDTDKALQLYAQGLGHYPTDAVLWTLRCLPKSTPTCPTR